MADHLWQLERRGFIWVRGAIGDPEEACEFARALINERSAVVDETTPVLLGEFVLPPVDAHESRDFQTLHFDFGLPLEPKVEHDVGRYTALHIPSDFGRVSAVTRLVPLRPLLSQRVWPAHSEILARLISYGRTHGAWDDADGYTEGSLARLVEAADGTPALPSVKAEAGFLCGMEFESLRSELQFFHAHSLRPEEVQIEVPFSPGELLVFDNLAVAHGRRGVRRPGELRQWVFGESRAGVARQRELRDRVLLAFGDNVEARSAAGEHAGFQKFFAAS